MSKEIINGYALGLPFKNNDNSKVLINSEHRIKVIEVHNIQR